MSWIFLAISKILEVQNSTARNFLPCVRGDLRAAALWYRHRPPWLIVYFPEVLIYVQNQLVLSHKCAGKIQFWTITSATTFNEHLKWTTLGEHVINAHQSPSCCINDDLITICVRLTKRLTSSASFYLLAIFIHWTHHFFSDWPAYSEFSKSVPVS